MTADDETAVEAFAEQIADRVLPRPSSHDSITSSSPPRCRVCQCTEERACQGGCCWTDERRDLCSACALTLCDQTLELPGQPELELRLRAGQFAFKVLSMQHGECLKAIEELTAYVRLLMADREVDEAAMGGRNLEREIWLLGDEP